MKKILATLALSGAMVAPLHADGLSTYQVSITNATAHQVLTPPVLISHKMTYAVFTVGSEASAGLVTQAETGNPAPLALEASNAVGVMDVVTGSNVIPYGQTATFQITASRRGRITLTTMLATTNDGFAALHSVTLPKHSAQYFAYVYDAGSEYNNESCSYIPGPPCTPESGNARTDNGEGFVSIHNGIHGINDLTAANLDWRGPAAVVTITRIDG
jgi:hypothetical protein